MSRSSNRHGSIPAATRPRSEIGNGYIYAALLNISCPESYRSGITYC